MSIMRHYLNIINEATADDYFRKIDALDAMINDKATTPGEKSNAASLKAKVEKKLKDEFPNAQRSAPKDKVHGYGSWDDVMKDPWFQWAKGMGEYLDKEKLWQTDRNAAEAELRRLIDRRKQIVRSYMPGDTEGAQDLNDAKYAVDRFMRKYLPDLWKAEVAKRDVANHKAGLRADKKRAEKDKVIKQANKGLLTYSQSKAASLPFAQKLKDKIKGVHSGGKYRFMFNFKDSNFLTWLADCQAPVVRVIVQDLSTKEKQELCNLIDRCAEQGLNTKVFTRKQKDDLIKKINSTPPHRVAREKYAAPSDEDFYNKAKQRPKRYR
jgi:hypothetical protein